MRKDMAKLVVKGHSRKRDGESTKLKPRDYENAPERARMKDGYGWSDGPRDHLNPLSNFLEKNVNRPWNKVYSEICEVTDRRSFEGKHLLDHIDREVISEEELIARLEERWPYSIHQNFYYDSKGILRRYTKRSKCSWKKQQDPDHCQIDGQSFTRINNCWFTSSFYGYEDDSYKEFDPKLQRNVTIFYKKPLYKFHQLNKKELKYFGLSNDPNWKWYE